MANTQSPESPNDQSTELPSPEVLKPKDNEDTPSSDTGTVPPGKDTSKGPKLRRRGTYRPSHKATFIGLAVVAAILAVNAVVITFVLKNHSSNNNPLSKDQVTISSSALDKLGVNSSAVGDSGIELSIGPDTKFDGSVQVAGDVNISGQLALNSKFTASDASLTQLEAGNTSLSQLDVNGNGTITDLNLRNNLVVTGTTWLNGTTTVGQLLTVNSNENVAGNLAVGGTLSVGSFQTTSLTVSGHVITAGNAPSVSAGSCIGSNGTVSISGNDTTGTVAINTGSGACAGVLANVVFRNPFTGIPNVVITPVGVGGLFFVNRSTTGFSIGDSSAPVAGIGYAFDYIAEQ